jgi:hypothetical protein
MRLGVLCAALLSGLLATLAIGVSAQASASASTIPVVVELFTSEGCSDCPPADNVLARLATQPVPGVQILALGEHVDYWDKQGWRDPFSSSAFTARQVDYTRALHIESAYTPQMVVNGRDEFVGSDYGAAVSAIAKAARDRTRQLQVSLLADRVPGATIPVHVKVDGAGLRGPADVFVAVTEDNLSSHVERGENRGKDLHHTAVVRSLTRIGAIDAKAGTWTAGGEIARDRAWKTGDVHIVALVQEHGGRAILGAAAARLP